ncbi:MAG: DUF126 domain-containing protein [Tissierellales bacterium]|nr:DUF126 domain-containing protein [Tissierellales bacterium]MBN2827370.1 DUF126 domain-containing protein [Tissierellales bacterium]
MANIVYKGRGAIPGVAEGIALVSRETIQGWSGIDENTGMIVEKGHPFEGMSISGNILILSGGKGSNGWSCHFHAASVKGIGPSGFIFPKMDSRTGVAAVVTGVPTITDLEVDPFTAIKTGDRIRIDGTNGTVEILSE